MNRRNFLSKLGFGTAAVAATTVVPAALAPTKEAKLEDGSLRPRCSACGERVLVRYDGATYYAFCPVTTCKRYGLAFRMETREEIRVHVNEGPGVSEKLIASYDEQVPPLVEYTEKKEKKYRIGKRWAR